MKKIKFKAWDGNNKTMIQLKELKLHYRPREQKCDGVVVMMFAGPIIKGKPNKIIKVEIREMGG